jgi:iduronate 2-sulfatase
MKKQKKYLIALVASLLLFADLTGAFAAEQKIRNVLLIVADDLTTTALKCYGGTACKTPNIDKLAERGMVFMHNYCQSPLCVPSRPSFMFSQYPGVSHKDQPSIGEHFIENGYYSARCSKVFHMGIPNDIISGGNGQDVPACWSERFNVKCPEAMTPGEYACLNLNEFKGKDDLTGRRSIGDPNRLYVAVKAASNGEDQPDYKTADIIVDLLKKHKDKPFFIAAGFVRPHDPCVAPSTYFDKFTLEECAPPKLVPHDWDDKPKASTAVHVISKDGLTGENINKMRIAYFASVSFMDAQVGKLLDTLDELGLRDNTAIFFISDNGYLLGEHGYWSKVCLYEECAKVPLIISAPGMKSGVCDSLTELVDIYPTMCDLTGISIPKETQGRSLMPILTGTASSVRDSAVSMRFPGKAYLLRTMDFAYTLNSDKSEELYDMKSDPQQIHNQIKNPEYKTAAEKMRTLLDERIQKDIGVNNSWNKKFKSGNFGDTNDHEEK